MARIKKAPGPTLPLTSATIKSRGRFYVRATMWGDVAQTWPQKRKNWKNLTNLEQRENFKAMVKAVQNVMPEDRAAAQSLASGSGFTYRDVLSRMVTGHFLFFDPSEMATIQELLDTITTTTGAIIFRSAAGWIGLDPGTDGHLLETHGPDANPTWSPAPATGGSGLYASFLSDLPTQLSTGLATSLNIGTVTVTDTAAGITLNAPASAGNNQLHGIYKAVPATPYSVTTLMLSTYLGATSKGAGIGWYDGINKLQYMQVSYDSSAHLVFTLENWDHPTSLSSTLVTAANVSIYGPAWMRLTDDGTTISFQISQDGDNFLTFYTVAKSAGYLGSTGYANIFIGFKPMNTAMISTLASYAE